MCADFVESLGSALHSETSTTLQSAGDESNSELDKSLSSDREGGDLSESSENEPPDVHALGDETMVDDGIANADVRESIVNVAPGEGQHPICLYLDKDAEGNGASRHFRWMCPTTK
jgi:hypothetical protein